MHREVRSPLSSAQYKYPSRRASCEGSVLLLPVLCVAAGHVVTAFSAVLELEALCICTAEGALLLLHTSSQQVEQVGHLHGGVASAAWSPDGAVLLVLTALGRILLMNQVSLPLLRLLCDALMPLGVAVSASSARVQVGSSLV